ncbi:hypothetical protein QE152_g6746 [Popillia japonica]|uniref:Uncharacterized protein n=1 Tax=Popillia japonica TaxID=7064 RepID=A0AAW1MH45_POPJA
MSIEYTYITHSDITIRILGTKLNQMSQYVKTLTFSMEHGLVTVEGESTKSFISEPMNADTLIYSICDNIVTVISPQSDDCIIELFTNNVRKNENHDFLPPYPPLPH